MQIEVKPGKVARLLLVLAGGFTLAYIAGQLAEIHLGRNFGLFLFDPSGTQSIPRFYAAVTLLLCSGLLLTIAMAKKGDSTHSFLYWLGLALIFLMLAITKITAVHESLSAPFRSIFNISKLEFYAYTYGIVILLFSVFYLKFLLSLPRRIMLLLFIGGSTFVMGLFGLDLIVAYLGKSIDHHTMTYIGLTSLEELTEMGGVILLAYALLSYMSSELRWIGVKVVE